LKLSKPECQFLDGSFLLPSFSDTLYIIRCNQNRFLYYLSVYVKSFKELFLLSLRESVFSKASAKVLTIFQTTKYFQEKV